MRVLMVARKHKALVATGAVIGIILALAAVFRISSDSGNVVVERRSPGTYYTTVNAVIDTAEFGIGRTDTDLYRLALLAPTYAQLIKSEPVLERAAESLGAPIDAANVDAVPLDSSPMVKLTVKGSQPTTLAVTATAIVAAFKGYVTETQAKNATPMDVRISIEGVGQPSPPELESNRQLEIGLIALLLPLAAAFALAFRAERAELQDKAGSDKWTAQV